MDNATMVEIDIDVETMIADLQVAAGVAYLASQGYSITEIDTDILDIRLPSKCPAGQTVGYFHMRTAIGAELETTDHRVVDTWCTNHGFLCCTGYHETLVNSCRNDVLTAAWRRAIGRARGEAA